MVLVGCANGCPFGVSVALVKTEQTYNPNATQENLLEVPTVQGSGCRLVTTGALAEVKNDLSGSSKGNKILEEFN